MAGSSIDELPDEALHHILSFLPTTKQRAATSLVSRRWRHLWTHVPFLDFPYEDFPDYSHPGTIDECLRRFSTASRPLHRLSVHIPSSPHERPDAYLTRWLSILPTTSLRALSLNCEARDPCLRLPPSVVSLPPSLRVLRLYHVDLTEIDWAAAAETPHRRGFDRLHTLVLDYVAIRDEQFRALLAACPLLENLRIHSTQLPINLSSSVNPLLKKVHASGDVEEPEDPVVPELQEEPKPFQVRIDLAGLEMLMLGGETMRDLHLAGSPQLREAWVTPFLMPRWPPESMSGVQAMPVTMSGVQIMTANALAFLLEYKERQEFAFPKLKVLDAWGIPENGIPEFGTFFEMPTPSSFVSFVSFLDRCPSLDTLDIWLIYKASHDWEDVELDKLGAGSTSSCPVKTIRLMNVTGCKRDKALIKYLLGKLACLQCLCIGLSTERRLRKWKHPVDIYNKLKLPEQVRQFARASPLVNIIVQTSDTTSRLRSGHNWFGFNSTVLSH